MNRAEKAVAIKHSGNNCCQAVLLAFADCINADEATLKRLGSTFGGGMGTCDATCGALCGAQMILGLVKGSGAKVLHSAFKNECGSTHCGELKGIGTGKVLCSCDDCVYNAAKLLEKMLEQPQS